jgi:Zn-dependent protease
MESGANTPEGPRVSPDSGQPSWGAASAWPAPYQPYPPQPVYPPPPEAYQPGAWPPPPDAPHPGAWPPQPGVYPPPPSWYQPGQPGAQTAPQWSAPAATWPPPPDRSTPPYYPYPAHPGYQQYPGYPAQPGTGPRPATQTRPSGTAVVGFISKVAVIAKLALPLASILASFGAYALLFGWQFGLGIIVLLFVHEMGHFVIIKGKGLPASLPIFIPLLGAFVAMRRMPLSVRDEAEIGIAGPLAGTVAGVVCLWLYAQLGLEIMLPLAYFSFFLNLLNLIPVSPLDGARVTSAISKWIWLIGLVGIAFAAWSTGNLLLILLGVFGFFQVIDRFRVAENTGYYAISPGARIYITILYFGLVAVLVYATFTLQPIVQQMGSPF